MNKLLAIFTTGALLCVSLPLLAAGDMECHHGMMMKPQAMDTDNDGTLSKEEFMKAHEAIWDKMTKNKDGLVNLKDMRMMHKHCMKQEGKK